MDISSKKSNVIEIRTEFYKIGDKFMIEFTGYLTGAALRHFNKKAIKVGQNMILGSIIFSFPFVAYISFALKLYIPIVVYFIGIILALLLIRIPKRKKENQKSQEGPEKRQGKEKRD